MISKCLNATAEMAITVQWLTRATSCSAAVEPSNKEYNFVGAGVVYYSEVSFMESSGCSFTSPPPNPTTLTEQLPVYCMVRARARAKRPRCARDTTARGLWVSKDRRSLGLVV